MLLLITVFYRKCKIYTKRQVKAIWEKSKRHNIWIYITWLKKDNLGFQVKPEQAPLSLFAPVTWKQGSSGLVDLYLANFRAFNSCVLSKCLGRRKRKVNQEKRKYGPQCVEGQGQGRKRLNHIHSHLKKKQTQNENTWFPIYKIRKYRISSHDRVHSKWPFRVQLMDLIFNFHW